MTRFLIGAVGNLLATIVIAVVIFLAFIALSQRNKTRLTLNGIGHALLSVLSAPIQFGRTVLTETVERVSARHRVAAPLLAERILFSAQLAVVLAAAWIIAAGVTRGWEAMTPDDGTVRAYRDAVAARDSLDALLPTQTNAVLRADSIWKADSATLAASFEDTLRARIQRSTNTQLDVRAQINARPRVGRSQLIGLLDELEQTAGSDEGAAARFTRRVRDLAASIRSMDAAGLGPLGFQSTDSTLMMTYLSAWRSGREATRLEGSSTARDARRVLQPEYAGLVRDRELSQANMVRFDRTIPALREAANWRQFSFITAVALALMKAFAFVWLSALVLEVAWLLWRMLVDAAHTLRAARGRLDSSADSSERGPAVSLPPQSSVASSAQNYSRV